MNIIREQRHAERFPTHCPVELDLGTGVTRNLSTTGVCFTMDKPLEANLMLRCFIIMQKMGREMPRLRCEGRVVRSEKSADGWDIAINFTTFQW